MRVGRERPRPDVAEQLAERGIAGDAGADHEGVHEEADEVLELGPVAARHGRAHGQVVRAGLRVEEGVERGEQRHEERGALGAAQRLERGPDLGGDLERGVAGAGARRRPVRVDAIPEGNRAGRAGERVLPVGEVRVVRALAPRPPLPDRIIGVLQRQWRERRGQARGERVVEGRELADEDAHGPAVGGDVVDGHEEHALARREADQAGARERTPGEVEGPGALLARDLREARGPRGALEALLVAFLDRHRRRGGDDLRGLVAGEHERGPERLVAPHDLVEAPAEGALVERAREAERDQDGVGGARGVELVEEPEPLLRGRERARRAPGRARDRDRGMGGASGLDAGGERGDGAALEQCADRELRAERVADARDDLHRGERVAAEVQERVVDAHRGDAEDVGPERRDGLLRGRAGRDVIDGERGAAAPGGGQRAVIDLAVRGERERRQRDEHGGDHVRGEARLEVPPELVGLARAPGGGDDVGAEAEGGGGVLAGDHGGLAHARVLREGGLDLARLDAEAADLHLLVHPADELERAPVVEQADAIAGAVEPLAGASGIGHEPLPGEPGVAQVAERQALAAEVELALAAGGHRREGIVQHERAGAGDRAADGHGGGALGDLAHEVPGGERGVLRRAVDVQEALRGAAIEHGADPPRIAALAAEEQGPEAAEGLGLGARHAIEERGRDEYRADGLRADQGRERGGVEDGLLGGEDEPGAVQEGAPYLEGGGVERERRGAEDPVRGRERDVIGAEHEPEHRAVGDGDALGPAGRAGGVDHVGQALGRGVA